MIDGNNIYAYNRGSSPIELMIDKGINMLETYPYMSVVDNARHMIKRLIRPKNYHRIDRYSWPHGLLAMALCQVGELDKITSMYDRWISSGLKCNSVDNVLSAYSLIDVQEYTNDNRYKEALDIVKNYVMSHIRDSYGSISYRANHPNDIYVDGVAMTAPFLCRYGIRYNDSEAVELSLLQLTNYISYGMDSVSGLPYQGYDIEESIKNGIIGWGRSVGWLLLAYIKVIEVLGSTGDNPVLYRLIQEYKRLVDVVIKYQHDDGYYRWQLQVCEGHIDTSATAMIGYPIARGVSLGYLDDNYREHAKRAWNAILNSTVEGIVYNASGECGGYGIYPQIYGSYPWGQGPAIMLGLEVDKL